jgi:superoxide dismutase, Fe-Mn family
MEIDRRSALAASAALAGGLATGAAAAAPAAAPRFSPVALPFNPAGIAGLSERLLTSHHQNNYGGAVRRLNQIADSVAALDPATTPGFQLNGLKREELLAWNSMILPGTTLAQTIERDFGSATRWQAEFTAMGKALGGGSGWVLLTWSARDRRLVNQWAADHSMTLAGATPLLALDMYEHAYHMDYGANAGAYVEAFMKAIDWREADRRFRAVAV